MSNLVEKVAVNMLKIEAGITDEEFTGTTFKYLCILIKKYGDIGDYKFGEAMAYMTMYVLRACNDDSKTRWLYDQDMNPKTYMPFTDNMDRGFILAFKDIVDLMERNYD